MQGKSDTHVYVQEKVSTTVAAHKAGFGRVTLQRWIRAGKVKAPKPVIVDGRAVRLWSAADLQALRTAKEKHYRKGRGRKKKVSK